MNTSPSSSFLPTHSACLFMSHVWGIESLQTTGEGRYGGGGMGHGGRHGVCLASCTQGRKAPWNGLAKCAEERKKVSHKGTMPTPCKAQK